MISCDFERESFAFLYCHGGFIYIRAKHLKRPHSYIRSLKELNVPEKTPTIQSIPCITLLHLKPCPCQRSFSTEDKRVRLCHIQRFWKQLCKFMCISPETSGISFSDHGSTAKRMIPITFKTYAESFFTNLTAVLPTP